jgi:hypothetical protein
MGEGRGGEEGSRMPDARCPMPFAILIFPLSFSEIFHSVSTGKFQVFHRFD